jgi:hypothetical protein
MQHGVNRHLEQAEVPEPRHPTGREDLSNSLHLNAPIAILSSAKRAALIACLTALVPRPALGPQSAGRQTATGRALLERRPVQVTDAQSDPEYHFPEALRLMSFRSVLAVPLLREGVPLGTIAVWKTEVAPFTDRQIELVGTFADQAVIAIIFANIIDPVASGFVASLSRPGGNATGYVILEPSMASKWPELLKEIAPRVNRIAILYNPATTTPFAEAFLKPFKAAAALFGVDAVIAPVKNISELESVVAAQAREPNAGLIAMPDSFLVGHRVEVTSLAARYRLPALYNYRAFTEVGGLMSYGK